MQSFISIAVGTVAFIGIDFLWVALLAKQFYIRQFGAHVEVSGGSIATYLPAVPLVYIIASIGLWVFVVSRATSFGNAWAYGALFGFVAYAIYDFTNLAILKQYSWTLTLVDIAWGTWVVALVSVIMFYVTKV